MPAKMGSQVAGGGFETEGGAELQLAILLNEL